LAVAYENADRIDDVIPFLCEFICLTIAGYSMLRGA